MSPNIPLSARPVFGPAVSPDGHWGGVPWMHGVAHPEPLRGLHGGQVTTFPYAPGRAVLAVTDSDNDLDGPGGSAQVDPCWQAATSLRYPGGASCNSRVFPGVVISPALEKFGVRLGDFCLVSWNSAVRSAQVYDIGPTRKAGENSLFSQPWVGPRARRLERPPRRARRPRRAGRVHPHFRGQRPRPRAGARRDRGGRARLLDRFHGSPGGRGGLRVPGGPRPARWRMPPREAGRRPAAPDLPPCSSWRL